MAVIKRKSFAREVNLRPISDSVYPELNAHVFIMSGYGSKECIKD
jgi:hypothetical protein